MSAAAIASTNLQRQQQREVAPQQRLLLHRRIFRFFFAFATFLAPAFVGLKGNGV
jgi:hypothetical protein